MCTGGWQACERSMYHGQYNFIIYNKIVNCESGYVCVYVCTRVYLEVCMYARMYASPSVCRCVRMYTIINWLKLTNHDELIHLSVGGERVG